MALKMGQNTNIMQITKHNYVDMQVVVVLYLVELHYKLLINIYKAGISGFHGG